MQHKLPRMFDRELKKGSAELLILSLVEQEPRHGYDIARLIEVRSKGVIQFKVASLYPLLYRLEARGWIQGRWVEKAGQRRRRYYRLTSEGRQILDAQRHTWRAFAEAIARVTGVEHA
jgi:PadR family transcriptional regulator